jgi:putative hydrolase of the HAD superfamily
LFFDLDRTLWDFDSNSVLALKEIFTDRKIAQIANCNFTDFKTFYTEYNKKLWDMYKYQKIEKEDLRLERFHGTLKHFGIDSPRLAAKISDDYVKISPQKTKLFPNVIDVLRQLKSRYELHIITNGFSEVQFIKLKNSGLSPFFNKIITSEMVGYQKPNERIFHFALKTANVKPKDAIMIGDDQDSDIRGAQKIGMDQLFINYKFEELICNPTFHINTFESILDIL